MTATDTQMRCPNLDVWMAFSQTRSEAVAGLFGPTWNRAALEDHLDQCGDCTRQLDEAQRFRALLSRNRAPGLSDAQRDVLRERVELMAGERVSAPARLPTGMLWAGALAAAITAFAVVGWQMLAEIPVETVATRVSETQVAAMAATADLRVGAIEGSIEVADGRGAFHPLQAGVAIEAGMQLRAPGGGEGVGVNRLTVPGQFEMRMQPKSELTVLATSRWETFFRLQRGEISLHVAPRAAGAHFGVMIGAFRASVVGTRFVVRHREDGAASVDVSEGVVQVDRAATPRDGRDETTMMVHAGQRWRHDAGRLELAPIPVPAAVSDRDPAKAQPAGAATEAGLEAEAATTSTEASAPADDGEARTGQNPREGKAAARASEPSQRGPRYIVLELPPQRMSDEEIGRLKALEAAAAGRRGDSEAP